MDPVAVRATDLLPAPPSWHSARRWFSPRTTRVFKTMLTWASNLVTVLALAIFVGLVIGPKLFGYQTQTMLTGSMAPRIDTGDVVVANEVPVERLVVGDVITYSIPVSDHRVVSHRIVDISRTPDGSTTVQTKGDANSANDPWVATIQGNKAWRVSTVLPKLGTLLTFLREPPIAAEMRLIAPAGVALLLLAMIWMPAGPAQAGAPRRPTPRHRLGDYAGSRQ
jgi:signal peptidase